MRSVRSVVVAMLGLGIAQPALSADLPILRGAQLDGPSYRWDGLYAGLQAGGANAGSNFSDADLSNQITTTGSAARQATPAPPAYWISYPSSATGSTSATYGAFIGYNYQTEDVVLGWEVNYSRPNAKVSSGGIWPQQFLINGVNYDGYTTTLTTTNITDVVTGRGRAGWAIGCFLPYVTFGGALGVATHTIDATIASGYPFLSSATSKTTNIIYGYTFGAGLDVALTSNVFLRGEYEYVHFTDLSTTVNNFRGAVGVRF